MRRHHATGENNEQNTEIDLKTEVPRVTITGTGMRESHICEILNLEKNSSTNR